MNETEAEIIKIAKIKNFKIDVKQVFLDFANIF